MESLDSIRKSVLDEADAIDRKGRLLIYVNAFVEFLLAGLYLIVMDFHNTMHWLILIAASWVYFCLFINQYRVSNKLEASNRRILQAIELMTSSQNKR